MFFRHLMPIPLHGFAQSGPTPACLQSDPCKRGEASKWGEPWNWGEASKWGEPWK